MQTPLQKLNVQEILTFPKIRKLRGLYGLTYEKLADVMGMKNHQTVKKRLRDGDFTIDEEVLLVDFFINLGENVTIQSVFFDWISTNVEKKEV